LSPKGSSPKSSNGSTKQLESRRQFLSEAFHSFHQPLTALHCGLELSLLKQRSEQEYRQRIAEALQHAGTVLQLNKALRELAEATDPGENIGRIELRPVLTQLADELALVADAAQVLLKFNCPEELFVSADAEKFSRHIGTLANLIISDLEPESTCVFQGHRDERGIVVELLGEGIHRKNVEDGPEHKLRSIRTDAACSYVWTIGGDLMSTPSGFRITLPALQ